MSGTLRMLHLQGHVPLDEVLNFGKYNVKLGGHPDRNKLDQIYALRVHWDTDFQ